MKILIRVQSREGDCFIRLEKKGQITGSDLLFYSELRRFDFRGISRPTCQIFFFIRIQIAFLSGFWFEIEIFGAMTENG